MASDPTYPGRRQPELPGAEEDADIPPPPHGLQHDPLDEETQARLQRMTRRSRTLPTLLVVVALGAFVAIVWWAYQNAYKPSTPGELPVVEAEPGDVKVRPESEGGLDVPNQDKLIYEQLGSGEAQPEVERLMPPPEEPLEPPSPPPAETAALTPPPPPQDIAPSAEIMAEAPATANLPEPPDLAPAAGGQAPEAPQSPAPETAAATVADAAPPAPPAPELPVIPAPESAPVAAAEASAAAAPAAEVPESAPAEAETASAPETAPEVAPQVAAAAGFRIQLASVKSEADADKEWTRLRKIHGDLIGDLQPTVQRADLGTQGIFYRIQGGPLASREAAAELCEKLKAKNQGCLVVKP